MDALLGASRCPEVQETMNGTLCDEDSTVFFLELLIRVVLQNRDRIGPFWQSIRDHVYNIVVNNASTNSFLVERAVVGLLRLAIRLLRRDDLAPQVAFGLHELLKTNAANIHSASDWYTLFTLLEVVGAGTNPPPLMQVEVGVNVPESIADAGAQSDSEVVSSQPANGSAGMAETTSSDRGYTSDSELYENLSRHGKNTVEMDVYNHRDDTENTKRQIPINQYNIALNEELCYHDAKSLIKCCETLAFLVRDAAHITPHNFESCVHAIRTFVEANVNGAGHPMRHSPSRQTSGSREKKVFRKHSKREESRMKKSRSSPSHLQHLEDSDEEEGGVDADIYHSLSIQVRHLPVPLYTGIARLCCDTRRQVRSQALTYLQRALLVHDLQTLSAVEWESCFNKVLFPLLSKLLDNINPQDPTGIEETRMRASTLLCKVFLQHLSPLLSLSTFTALWLTILEFMDKYMHVDRSDLLCEAIPESLKNMLLVMHTAGILRHQRRLVSMTMKDNAVSDAAGKTTQPTVPPVEPSGGLQHSAASAPAMTSPQLANSNYRRSDSPNRDTTGSPVVTGPSPPPLERHSNSPLTVPMPSLTTGQYILHPPLPNITSPPKMVAGTHQPLSVLAKLASQL
ncbi:hypothetical protein NP493_86g03005 [Ridgeia piscesae]|uniref:GBF1-like tetratricopeptide repeats domain-containing protein n=1 Tax=Ridgeia piscesae TaxID=27915 RepID=A0AAD9UHV9_RIDPI|nr:hypothetical protein NP493_86g03005 [Ridgeia piscesae]